MLGRARRLHGWSELSERQAVVVALKEQGTTHQEIAELLGISKTAVDKYSQRARRKLPDAVERHLSSGTTPSEQPGTADRIVRIRQYLV